MTLNSLLCADVPLSTYTLTHLFQGDYLLAWVCLSVCLSVCEHDYMNGCEWQQDLGRKKDEYILGLINIGPVQWQNT